MSNTDLLHKIYEDEEDEMVPYAIREEIINRALDEIEKKYLKNQLVNYVVQCACDALVQYLNFEFYFHHNYNVHYAVDTRWIPDTPPQPSQPDTWAAHKVPVLKSPKIVEEVCQSESSSISNSSILTGEKMATSEVRFDKSAGTETSTQSTMETSEIDYRSDIAKYLMAQKYEEAEAEEDNKDSAESEVSFNKAVTETGVKKILSNVMTEVDKTINSEHEFVKFAQSLKLGGKCELIEGTKHKNGSIKLPKISVINQRKLSRRGTLVDTLPTVRLPSTFNAMPVEDSPKKKGKKKHKE